jgi:hypothetical protein
VVKECNHSMTAKWCGYCLWSAMDYRLPSPLIVGSVLFGWLLFDGLAMAQQPTDSEPLQPLPAVQPEPQQPAAPPTVVVVPPTQPVPSNAGGQPSTVYVYELPPPPAYTLPPPPPPPIPKKEAGAYTHDGFYLRMGIGIGAVGLTDDSPENNSLSAGGGGLEIGLGGTVENGFVLGGRVIGVGANVARVDAEGKKVSGNVSYAALQFFADWYVDPESGLHFEGALGTAGIIYDPTPSRRTDREGDEVTLGGFGGSLGVGWEGWVGEEWSLGGLLRLNWAWIDGVLDPSAPVYLLRESGNDDNSTIFAVAPMLMFTATLH